MPGRFGILHLLQERTAPVRKTSLITLSILVACAVAACGGGEPAGTPTANAPAAAPPSAPVSLDKNDYPVFPEADSGADATVAADLGGRGFTGEGWETNTEYDLIGDPRAVKGGTIREYQLGRRFGTDYGFAREGASHSSKI